MKDFWLLRGHPSLVDVCTLLHGLISGIKFLSYLSLFITCIIICSCLFTCVLSSLHFVFHLQFCLFGLDLFHLCCYLAFPPLSPRAARCVCPIVLFHQMFQASRVLCRFSVRPFWLVCCVRLMPLMCEFASFVYWKWRSSAWTVETVPRVG